jgi:hypothetical protein
MQVVAVEQPILERRGLVGLAVEDKEENILQPQTVFQVQLTLAVVAAAQQMFLLEAAQAVLALSS